MSVHTFRDQHAAKKMDYFHKLTMNTDSDTKALSQRGTLLDSLLSHSILSWKQVQLSPCEASRSSGSKRRTVAPLSLPICLHVSVSFVPQGKCISHTCILSALSHPPCRPPRRKNRKRQHHNNGNGSNSSRLLPIDHKLRNELQTTF